MSDNHVTLNVEGMTCNHCVASITKALMQLNGVENVIVNLEMKRVAIEFDAERMNVEILKGTVEDAGYKVR